MDEDQRDHIPLSKLIEWSAIGLACWAIISAIIVAFATHRIP